MKGLDTQNANFNNLEKSNTALKLKKMTETQFFFLVLLVQYITALLY